jgi:hypothetical protein
VVEERARFAQEKQVLRYAQDDNKKGKGKSRFPPGMTNKNQVTAEV